MIDTSCQAFNGISWSKQDTDQTIKEIKQHNAVLKSLCGDPTKTP